MIGVLVGGAIGRQMDQADQACVAEALEHTSGERPVYWSDPDDSVRYEVTPLGTDGDESGRFCREYVTTAVIDGRVEEIRDTACREPEGGWRRMCCRTGQALRRFLRLRAFAPDSPGLLSGLALGLDQFGRRRGGPAPPLKSTTSDRSFPSTMQR